MSALVVLMRFGRGHLFVRAAGSMLLLHIVPTGVFADQAWLPALRTNGDASV